ncbi:hypothetical protein TNCV_722811 [Trichonephila clavipes]|nr:hypothetical protein TNCV_722811 [Trichonephila clavipes]
MGHEDELTTEELQEILNEEHQETQENVFPSEQEEDETNTVDEVSCRLEAAGDELPVSVIQSHFDSMPNRCRLGLQKLSGQGIGSWQACHEFEPSATKDSPCNATMQDLILYNFQTPCRSKSKSKHPFRAFPLTPEHRQLRLQWCQARSMWNVTDWQKIVFSDESGFVLGTYDNRVRV